MQLSVIRTERVESQFDGDLRFIGGGIPAWKFVNNSLRVGHRSLFFCIKHFEEARCEDARVPVCNAGLIGESVSPLSVYGTELGIGLEGVNKRAGSVVNRFAGEQHVVSVHYAVNEAETLPLRDECGDSFDRFFK